MSTIIDKTDSLALKLKDAGFPFKEYYLEQHSGKDSELKWNNKFWEYPSLDELIEACKDEFNTLRQIAGNFPLWEATSLTKGWAQGITMELAVAYLWLALNRKS